MTRPTSRLVGVTGRGVSFGGSADIRSIAHGRSPLSSSMMSGIVMSIGLIRPDSPAAPSAAPRATHCRAGARMSCSGYGG